MSRTDIDAATLARSLRLKAGDGSMEWVTGPMQASVLLDIADLLDENAKLREERDMYKEVVGYMVHPDFADQLRAENAKLRELCKDMMAFVEDDDACERCGHDAECVEAADGELVLPYEGRCLMLDLFADRMRELGVEP